MRQVDVTVRKPIGQFEMLVVLDCKDYAEPADVKVVEEFIGLSQDVGAHQGAIVAARGFTSAAKTRAKDAGVALYSIVDTGDHKWRVSASLPTLCDFRGLGFSVRLQVSAPVPVTLYEMPPYIQVFSTSGQLLGRPVEIIRSRWNAAELPNEPGTYENFDFLGQRPYIDNGYGRQIPVALTADLHVTQRLYFGQVALAKISGFKDELAGGIVTRAIESVPLSFAEIEETWEKVESKDQLAVSPVVRVTATDVYPED